MVKLFYFILLFVFLGCKYANSEDEIYKLNLVRENFILKFENLGEDEYFLEQSFFEKKRYLEKTTNFITRPILDISKGVSYTTGNEIALQANDEIAGDFRRWLLIKWDINSDSDSAFIQHLSISYLGHLKGNRHYESFLLLANYDNGSPMFLIKNVLQVNHIGCKIVSIVEKEGYLHNGFSTFTWWTERKGKDFIFKFFDDVSDFGYTDEAIEQLKENGDKIDITISYSKYRFTETGLLEVTP